MSENTPPSPAPTGRNLEASPEKTFLGLTLGDAIKYLLGLVAGLLLAIFGLWINKSSPHLAISVSESVQFEGKASKFGILSFSVANDGSKEATNVVCAFKIHGARKPDIRATPDILNPQITIQDDMAVIKLASLNQGERLNVVAHIPDVLPDKPTVTVRGDGSSV
jgi:hypothetical protein